MRGREIPASADRSYWYREARAHAPFEPCPPLQGEVEADVLIVGGGYTGLWTAWHLTEREPDARVVLLERDLCGAAASGRNGGFLTGWWDDLPDLASRYGMEPALTACRALDESVVAIGEWIRERGVDTWHVPAGYLAASSSPAQDGLWREATEAAEAAGSPDAYRELTPEDVRAICDSPALRGGAFMPAGATVQPARLGLALRAALLERGVKIREGTHVRRLHTREPVLAETDGGRVRARRAVVATNAWAAGWRALRGRLVVRGSYVLVTEPAPERLEEIGWTGGEAITDLRAALFYFRTTPDGRIAFGGAGRAGLGSKVGSRYDHDPVSMDHVYAGFRRFFPLFDGVGITEAWGGAVDVAALHHPVVGTLRGGAVHHATGYSGNGVAPSHLLGRALAALTLHAEDQTLALPMVGAKAKRFPPEPFRSVGAAIVQSAIMRRERLEDESRRVGWLTRLLSTMPRRMGYALGRSD